MVVLSLGEFLWSLLVIFFMVVFAVSLVWGLLTSQTPRRPRS